jgi:hypothetical protein
MLFRVSDTQNRTFAEMSMDVAIHGPGRPLPGKGRQAHKQETEACRDKYVPEWLRPFIGKMAKKRHFFCIFCSSMRYEQFLSLFFLIIQSVHASVGWCCSLVCLSQPPIPPITKIFFHKQFVKMKFTPRCDQLVRCWLTSWPHCAEAM